MLIEAKSSGRRSLSLQGTLSGELQQRNQLPSTNVIQTPYESKPVLYFCSLLSSADNGAISNKWRMDANNRRKVSFARWRPAQILGSLCQYNPGREHDESVPPTESEERLRTWNVGIQLSVCEETLRSEGVRITGVCDWIA